MVSPPCMGESRASSEQLTRFIRTVSEPALFRTVLTETDTFSTRAAGLPMNRPETPKMRDWQKRNFAAAVKKKVTDIEATFKAFDMDGSGKISHPEFIQAVRDSLCAPHR